MVQSRPSCARRVVPAEEKARSADLFPSSFGVLVVFRREAVRPVPVPDVGPVDRDDRDDGVGVEPGKRSRAARERDPARRGVEDHVAQRGTAVASGEDEVAVQPVLTEGLEIDDSHSGLDLRDVRGRDRAERPGLAVVLRALLRHV